jgi:CorA-like Mg2+ transporter protein
MNSAETPDSSVRHFRQILMWPLQLMPLRADSPVKQQWQAFASARGAEVWREVEDEFPLSPQEFQERHYREFVTFLPHVQRFLYGQGRSSSTRTSYGDSPMRVFRRSDVAHARLTFEDGRVLTLRVRHVDLYFYYDVDVVMLAFEYHADDLPLRNVLEIGSRFARVYPARWNEQGVADQCLHNVEWLGADQAVLAESDFADRPAFLSHTCQHRQPRIGRHWDFLLRPMVQHDSEAPGDVRYRLLEYHLLPQMTYLALEDPFALSRAEFYRLGMVTEPDVGLAIPLPNKVLRRFERQHCFDLYWAPEQRDVRASTRIICTPRALVMLGSSSSPEYTDHERGRLGEFRHQYFLLCMIVHFHHAALLMLSDRLVFAVSRLDIGDPESLARFRLHMRDTTEIFLRFNHRYWFHDVSRNLVARQIFRLLSDQRENHALFQEVREELLDMGNYLESAETRRQGDIVLRLTVVTIFGLIATIVTGFLGMNLIDETNQPLEIKVAYFMAVLVPAIVLTFFSVMKSGGLASFIDTMASERLSMREKLSRLAFRRSGDKSA